MSSHENKKELLLTPTEAAGAQVAQAVRESIVEPLALLAGLFGKQAEGTVPAQTVGYLLGLIVRGARAELAIHEAGGYAAKELIDLIGQHGKGAE